MNDNNSKFQLNVILVDQFYVGDGCLTNGKEKIPVGYKFKSFLANTRCCDIEGVSCITPNTHCPKNAVTYDKAVEKCQKEGRRLCTKVELNSGVCCGTGGGCDHHLVWTSTKKIGKN